MPISNIPPEILQNIFEHFSSNLPLLLICALVNCSWCAVAIPILWRNPFRVAPKQNRLVDTYFKCFDKKTQMRILGKKVLHDNTILRNDLIFETAKQPMFRYASFLRVLDIENIYRAITSWTPHPPNAIDITSWFPRCLPKTNYQLQQLFVSEFFRFLWHESVVIQQLIIGRYEFQRQTLLTHFWTLPIATECFSKLSSLHLMDLEPAFPADFFSFLESNCHHIRHIYIASSLTKGLTRVASFIKAQKHLHSIRLKSPNSSSPIILSAT